MPPVEAIVAKLVTAPLSPEMSTPNMPPEIRAAVSVGLPLTTVSVTPAPPLRMIPALLCPSIEPKFLIVQGTARPGAP